MSTQYQITRDKFFEIKQRSRILKSSDEHAELDRMKISISMATIIQWNNMGKYNRSKQ